jgi:hypothetical protein
MVKNTGQLERQQVSKRCRDLATIMETIMDDISKSDLKVDLTREEQSFSVSLVDFISPNSQIRQRTWLFKTHDEKWEICMP